MIETSRMSGTSSMVVRPTASRAAAISLSALFFAPVTRTRPDSAVPPVTSKHSTGSPYGGPAAGSRPEEKDPVLLIPRTLGRSLWTGPRAVGSFYYARGHD